MRSLPQDTLTGLGYPSVISCGLCSQILHLQTSPGDRFRVIWGTSPLRGMTESYLSLQKLQVEVGRVVQNPTALPQGRRGSEVLFQLQRITKKDTEAKLLEPHPCLYSPSSLPHFPDPLQVSPDSIPCVKHSQIIPPKEKPSKQTNQKTKNSSALDFASRESILRQMSK